MHVILFAAQRTGLQAIEFSIGKVDSALVDPRNLRFNKPPLKVALMRAAASRQDRHDACWHGVTYVMKFLYFPSLFLACRKWSVRRFQC
jgi:hypothetical protein